MCLLGASGDKLAAALGNSDGQMPTCAWIPGDFDPCDKCKEQGIAILEVGDADDKPTGHAWLVKEDFIRSLLNKESNAKLLKNVLGKRMCVMPEQLTRTLGIYTAEAERKRIDAEGEK